MSIRSISVNLGRALDNAYENEELTVVLDASPEALAGITAETASALRELLGITSVRDLGTNKYFATAGVLVALENRLLTMDRVGRSGLTP